MSKPTIFGFPQSTYVRTVRLTCAEKGVDYDLVPMGFSSEGLRDRHPFSRIPAFQHGEIKLYETSAICRYIDAAFEGPPLIPREAEALARMEQWISVTNAYVDPPVIRAIVMERVVKPMLGQEVDEELCRAAKPKAMHALSILDDGLSDGAFLAGPDISLADFFLLPIVFYLRQMSEGREILPGLENLNAWYDRLKMRPSFEYTQPPPPGER